MSPALSIDTGVDASVTDFSDVDWARPDTAEWLLGTRWRWRPTATPEDIEVARPLLEECVRDGGDVEVYDQVSVTDRARDFLEQLPKP